MASDRYGLTPRDQLALDAAKLYYTAGLSQQEISDLLHVSRPHISKLVAAARERGFVRMQVVDPRESDADLIDAVRRRFDLTEVRLVMPVNNRPMGHHQALGDAAAEMLSTFVGPHDVVGFWWSGLLHSFARSAVRANLRPREFVQLNGTDPYEAVETILEAFSSQVAVPVHLYPHPILHEDLTARLAAAEDQISRSIVALQSACDVAIFSPETAEESDLWDSPLMTDPDRTSILNSSVGQICGRFIDAEGRIVAPSLSQRTLGPTLTDLRKIKRTVLVGGGHATIPIIRAALGSRYANHLVTDIDTATALAQGK
ncbi:sugar-binding transcriptional regulator [Demetria terragena]|uniref:sugar-binding transcriptional regulator n=1 Tax=Demetria terragena TaxID=63959 RepID=UPI00037AD9A2|nr:sugar-binding domain-containing protein [Demetria terragena]